MIPAKIGLIKQIPSLTFKYSCCFYSMIEANKEFFSPNLKILLQISQISQNRSTTFWTRSLGLIVKKVLFDKFFSLEQEKRYQMSQQIHLVNSLASTNELRQKFHVARAFMKQFALLIFQRVSERVVNKLLGEHFSIFSHLITVNALIYTVEK